MDQFQRFFRRQRWCRFHPWIGKIPLEKEMATHSSILAWSIPRTSSLGGYSPQVYKESDMTERLILSFSFQRFSTVKSWTFLSRHCSSAKSLWFPSKPEDLVTFVCRISSGFAPTTNESLRHGNQTVMETKLPVMERKKYTWILQSCHPPAYGYVSQGLTITVQHTSNIHGVLPMLNAYF